MAVKSASRSPSVSSLTDQDKRWATIYHHLERGEYEHVISDLQNLSELKTCSDFPHLESMIKTANQICLTSNSIQEEVDWYEKAQSEAKLREGELLQQLLIILRLIEHAVVPKSRIEIEQTPNSSHETASIWERVRKLLGFEQLSQTFDRRLISDPVESGNLIANKSRAGLKVTSGKKDDTTTTQLAKIFGRITGKAAQLTFPIIDNIEDITTERKRQEFPGRLTSILTVERIHSTRQGFPSLTAYFLGAFQLFQGEKLISNWDSLKAKSILKYLLFHQNAPIIKDVLMDVFWPDASPEAARRNLHQAIYTIRQELRKEHPDFQYIKFENDRYFLNPELDIILDVVEFEDHVKSGRQLEAVGALAQAIGHFGIAEGLYQGDFLEEDIYEDWPNNQRQMMKNLYFDITDRLSEYYIQQQEFMIAITLCRKILAKDNCHETAHNRLMKCYLAQGQRHLAIHQYHICVQSLKNELDLVPSSETRALYDKITKT